MKKTLLAGLATGLLLVGMVGVASATTLLSGSFAAFDGTVYTSMAGLNYELLDNLDGTLTFNLTPGLSTGSPYLQALTVGIVNEAGTFGQDFTYGSSDGSTPVDELVSSDGGVTYSYTTAVGELTGQLGMFLMVNERSSDNGRDLQRWIGIESMAQPNDWGGFDWTWNNRLKFDAGTPPVATQKTSFGNVKAMFR